MKKWKLIIILFVFSSILFINRSYGQKKLSQSETQWVKEAQNDLEKAISQTDLKESDRLQLIEKGARTLKQYGQPPFHFAQKIPLRELTESRYEESKNQMIDAHKFYLKLNNDLLDQKIKIINSMQIDVTSKQINFLIPGETVISLSSEVVSTVFQYDLINGATGGQRTDAKDLKKLFIKLAEKKDLIYKLLKLEEDHKVKMNDLNKDLEKYTDLEKKIFKTYEKAEKSTVTFKGYEGAVPDENNTKNNTNSKLDMAIVGTWIYNAPGFNVVHLYNSDGTAVIRVNKTNNELKWETSGTNLITYFYQNGKTYTMSYKIEGNKLFYGSKNHKGYGYPLTRQ